MAPKMDKDYVLKTVEERGIRFIRFWFTDVLGQLKSFAVTDAELELAFEEGMGFDGSSIDGFTRIQESDMVAIPDPSTFKILPWRPDGDGVAAMFCDIQTPDGSPFTGDPRYALRRMLDKAAGMGYTMYVGPELEFFYFADDQDTQFLDHGGYFDLTPLDVASDLRRETVLTLEKLGIPVEYSHHEVAPSQHEIDLRYAEASEMADIVMTYRLAVKEIAYANGVYATFMPKPIAGENGSGMHVHQSLFDKDGNAFFDANDPEGFNLSAVGKSYIAGLLKYAPEFCAVTNQFVNSYKRLVPGYEAPVYVTWARRNRSAHGPRADVQARQGERHTRGASLAGPRRQPVPGLRGHARCRSQGYRGGSRAHARGHQQHLRHDRVRTHGRWDRDAAGYPRRGHRALRAVGDHEGDPGRPHPRVLRAQQEGRVGRVPAQRLSVGA